MTYLLILLEVRERRRLGKWVEYDRQIYNGGLSPVKIGGLDFIRMG